MRVYRYNFTAIFGAVKAVVKGVVIPSFVGFDDPTRAGKIFQQAWSNYGKEVGNAAKIDAGLFTADKNKNFGGKLWEIVSRFTWQLPQTIIGSGYSHTRNVWGKVDRVDYLGGATFVANENSKNYNGITFSNYINMNIREKIETDFKAFVTTVDPMYMHEYGLYLESQA